MSRARGAQNRGAETEDEHSGDQRSTGTVERNQFVARKNVFGPAIQDLSDRQVIALKLIEANGLAAGSACSRTGNGD